MPRRAAARRLKLVSNALVGRHFDAPPESGAARELLRVANARAPAGRPVQPGARPLWIYGAGSLGKVMHAHFEKLGQPVAGIVDSGAAICVDDPDWAGIRVVPPDGIPEAERAGALLAVAVVDHPYVPLETELHRLGWGQCVPVYDVSQSFLDRHPLANGWFGAALTEAELAAADEMLDGFADAASRAHYLRFAAWRLARQEWDFEGAPVEPESRDFIPEILEVLKPDERFLDAGACHGASTARLLREAGSVSTVWAIEPDALNRAVLQSFVNGLDLNLQARIQVLDAVLGARTEAVRFHEGLGYASQVAPTGKVLRASAPLDALGLDPTFVKLHLEGAELAALNGARETLRRRRPIVVVTVDHTAAGLFETPQWLMRHLPDYRIIMRTHAWCGTGAVLYAIPKERVPR